MFNTHVQGFSQRERGLTCWACPDGIEGRGWLHVVSLIFETQAFAKLCSSLSEHVKYSHRKLSHIAGKTVTIGCLSFVFHYLAYTAINLDIEASQHS